MKTLILIRHAKSDWGTPGLSDHQRPLNPRGRHDAPRMADALLKSALKPDLWLCSPALRAKETTYLMMQHMALAEEVAQLRESLYLASAEGLLEEVAATSDQISTLAITAHNPGMAELASMLSGTATAMPTCAVIAFRLPGDHWHDVLHQLQPEPIFYEIPERLKV